MKIHRIICGLSLFAFPGMSFATTAQENMYLTQILNQLDAVQPLILKAQHAAPPNQRITFHYTQYRDASGKKHHGLLEDVHAIQDGIRAKLNATSIEPRNIKPLQGDYLDTTPIKQGSSI